MSPRNFRTRIAALDAIAPSPHSALNTAGSAPVSNSASDHSRAFRVDNLKSIAHTSLITSTDRRLVRLSPGEVSPTLPAMGRYPPLRTTVAAPTPALQSTTMTSATSSSSMTTHTSVMDSITGEVSRIAHAAWTGGREREHERGRMSPARKWALGGQRGVD